MRILVADDVPFLLAVIAEFLEDLGHAVRTAQDGIEALEMLRAGPCDLLITDVRMPRMNGAQLIAAAAPDFPRLLVIVITGFAPDHKMQLIADSGAKVIAILAKPFEFGTLARLLDDAARRLAAAAA